VGSADPNTVSTTRAIADHEERRAEVRLELEVEVGLETEHNFYTGLTQDISSGGLFIATRIIYRVGDRLRVRLTLPGRAEPIIAEAEVRWLRDPRAIRTDGPEGIGLRFVDLTPEVRGEIAQFLKRRDSLFYDVD
jgi:type IV pilus assembly protein PilZ